MIAVTGAKTLVVTAASEVANQTSGTNSAVVVAVIGVFGLLMQMVVKDWLDGRKANRRHQQRIDDRDVIEDLRRENARLTRENHQLRQELEERHA